MAVFGILLAVVLILRGHSARWNVAIKNFNVDRNYAKFRDALLPLSIQPFNFVVRMKALVNLTWIHSYLGESEESKAVCHQVISKNKNLIGTTMAYAVLVQELILEQNWEEAEKQWKDAMVIGDADGVKAPAESYKLHLYGHIINKEYDDGLQMLMDPPQHMERWVRESEAGLFWTWYMHQVMGLDTSSCEQKLKSLPLKHKGMVRAMKNIMKKSQK